jgi:hypothetical protein
LPIWNEKFFVASASHGVSHGWIAAPLNAGSAQKTYANYAVLAIYACVFNGYLHFKKTGTFLKNNIKHMVALFLLNGCQCWPEACAY